MRGCLHAVMDLYKWAHKYFPWISSTLIMDAFEVAWEARALDMRASPYDLSAIGLDAIAVEAESGRRLYREQQRKIADAAGPVRGRLIQARCSA